MIAGTISLEIVSVITVPFRIAAVVVPFASCGIVVAVVTCASFGGFAGHIFTGILSFQVLLTSLWP